MSLTTMLIGIGIAALIFWAIQIFVIKKYENKAMSYLQAFVGILFIFSGWVKAMDPLGTAYKIEQYMGEFEGAFEASWMSFIAPIFPIMNDFATELSVGMIVFEIVLGVMILLGIYRKFAAWSFLILILVFTFMTGFTYLTGYVPQDGIFFDFSTWGAYLESNMKVTDCGCFGDFIKLEPLTSFFKDVFLLIPGVLFIAFSKKMHSLLNKKWAMGVTLVSLAITTLYCFSNYVWDIPGTDFRPFAKGVDVQETKRIEQEATASVQVTGFLMQNKKDANKMMEVSMAEYSKYSEEWSVLEQVKTESPIPSTKISEFDLDDIEGHESTYELLENVGKSVVIVAYELKGESTRTMISVVDTIRVFDPESEEEMVKYVNSEKQVVDFKATEAYGKYYTEKVVPFTNEAIKAGYKVFFLVGGASPEELIDFTNDVNLKAKILTGDDILMKTIIRSNPGVMIWDDAKIIEKYHITKLPSFAEAKI